MHSSLSYQAKCTRALKIQMQIYSQQPDLNEIVILDISENIPIKGKHYSNHYEFKYLTNETQKLNITSHMCPHVFTPNFNADKIK